MKLSTKGRYGVRLMIDLALHYGEGPILLKDIAERQGISEKYLWHLVDSLKISGFVNSTRGSHGGYALAKRPSEVNLNDIVSVLEGKLCLVDCVENPSICKRSQTCAARDVWEEVSEKIAKTLETITLQNMVEKQKSKETNSSAA